MERAVTEALAAYPGHVIVTLRARTDTVIETDVHGRQYACRISVRPEQRADIEYDFDAVGTLGPVATVDSLRDLWSEIVTTRAAGMAALDLHDQPVTLAELVSDRGRQLRALAHTPQPDQLAPPV